MVAVMLGSTFFDGFSRTSIWQNRYYNVQVDLIDRPSLADLVGQLMNLGGLLLVRRLRRARVPARRVRARSRSPERRPLSQEFIDSLIPIAFVYMIAHYFSLLLYQGEVGVRLLSDPWGRGWDLFGTHGFQPNFTFLTPHTIWYVQVGALVIGHVAGLAVAHDRAVGLFQHAADGALDAVPDARADGALHGRRPMGAQPGLASVPGLLWLRSVHLILAHGGIPGLIAETGSVFVALASSATSSAARRRRSASARASPTGKSTT